MQQRSSLERIALGIGLSLAAHALLLSLQRPSSPAQSAIPTAARFTVRLRAAEPPPAPQPPPQPQARPEAPTRTAAARPAPRPRPSRAVVALPDTNPATPEPAARFTVAPPDADTPQFDPEAAKKFARIIANERDPAKAGTALAQLPDKPLQTQSKYERAIAGAARGDCAKESADLLSPLKMLFDKKDSGCKWRW